MPILLTDLNFEKIRSKSKLLSTLEVTAPVEVTRKEIEEKYTVFYGEFDDEGAWNTEITFTATGPHFLQIVFVSNLEHQKDSFRIRGKFSQLMVFYVTWRRIWKPRMVCGRTDFKNQSKSDFFTAIDSAKFGFEVHGSN